MKDDAFYVLRALSLGLNHRRNAILLILSQQNMSIMSLTRATGQYRQLITNDVAKLLKMGAIRALDEEVKQKIYTITPAGTAVLGALKEPLELVRVENEELPCNDTGAGV